LVATVEATRIDPDAAPDEALFVVDFAPVGDGSNARLAVDRIRSEVSANRGEVRNIVLQQADSGGVRLTFRLHHTERAPIELSARLLDGERVISETWTYLADLP
jgi:glucans biosynthesis protein